MCKCKRVGCSGSPCTDYIQVQTDYDQTDISKPDYLLNKPKFKTVGGVPIIGTGDIPIGGGGSYILPIATDTILGGVMIGDTINIDVDGKINVPTIYSEDGILTDNRTISGNDKTLSFENLETFRYSIMNGDSVTLEPNIFRVQKGTYSFNVTGGIISFGNTNGKIVFQTNALTSDRTIRWQDKAGVVALLEDVTAPATIEERPTNYILSNDDNTKVLVFESATPVTLTVPDFLVKGFNVTIIQNGIGVINIVGSVGTSVNNIDNKFTTKGRYASVSILKLQSGVGGTVVISGDLI